MRERVSACLIVQDEQQRLPQALASVAFCDEVIVVDGGSSDHTVEIARAAGATVIENPWPGYAAQRNVALDAATGEWILELDADERISPRLRASIEGLLAAGAPGVGMAVCARREHLLGRPLGRAAKYPSYRARMFRRGSYRHDESRAVHEGVEPLERPLVLAGDMEHELAATLGEALADTWRYARLESLHVARPSTPRAYLTGILLRPAAKLLYRTSLDGGWRDGWRGLLKISLDATSDALVWANVLARGPRRTARASAMGGRKHFGRRPVGPVKVVAVADRGRPAQAATRWLVGLRSAGIDVALITAPERGGGGGASDRQASADGRFAQEVPLQAVERLGLSALAGALEIETQLRTTDAVVAVGRRARLLMRLLPGTLRPEIPGLGVNLDPESAAELARRGRLRR